MKSLIRKLLREHWEEKINPLAQELEVLGDKMINMTYDAIMEELKRIEDDYTEKYEQYEGDEYGIIDAMEQAMPYGNEHLARLFNDLHPKVVYETKKRLRKALMGFKKILLY